MNDSNRSLGRRNVLKRSAILGASILGSTGLSVASYGTEPVSGIIKGSTSSPVSASEIDALHDRVEKKYADRFGGSLDLAFHPVETDSQAMASYAVVVDAAGESERYHGLVPETRSVTTSTTDIKSETTQRHSAAEEFVSSRKSESLLTPQAISTSNFSEFGKITNEFGDTEGGKVIMTSTLYLNDDNSNVWGLGTNTQVIPGVNTVDETTGLSSSGRAEHRWNKSDALDPLIVDRAPTGTKDGTKGVNGSISVSIGTDTSGSGTIGGSYTQPDVYFSSKGSSVATELNWSYNTSSWDITWDTEYLSIADMCGGDTCDGLEYRDLITEDYYDGAFHNGPDATLGQLFQNVPNGGV